MQINKNRKGLALGAVLSLFASLFVGAAPASANTDGQYITLTPADGPITNFNGTLAEDFPLIAYVLPGQTAWASNGTQVVHHEITKVSGAMEVLVLATSGSAAIAPLATPASASFTTFADGQSKTTIEASSSQAVTITRSAGTNGAAYLNVMAFTTSGTVSSSPSVTLTIKTWVENPATANDEHDALEWYVTRTVVLHGINSIPVATTLASVEPGAASGSYALTASGTVSALNFENLSGNFFLQVRGTNNQIISEAAANSVSAGVTGVTLADRAGVVSSSFRVSGSAIAGTSFSAEIRYSTSSADVDGGFRLGNVATALVSGTKAGTLLVQAVSTSNSVMPDANTATVRANTTTTFKVTATSNSASISGAVVTVGIAESGGSTLAVNAKEISVNGAAATTSYPTALSLTTGTDGTATFTLGTSGFVGTEVLTITADEQNIDDSLTVNVKGIVPSLTAEYSLLSMAVGSTTPVVFSVKDQWGVASNATNLRIAVTKGGDAGFSYTDTLSYVAVTAGSATFNFSPTPATKTGSATVQAQLQEQQLSTGTFTNVGSVVTVTANVTPNADTFGAGLATSYSSSISYFPSTLAAAVAMGGTVTNSGSVITVTGPASLIFGDAAGNTASGTITVRAGSDKAYSVDVWATVEGTHTVTFTNGSATTTSLIIVSPAANDAGVAITFDTTSIDAGKTRIITGRVVDMNGNPVNTTGGPGTASLLVTFAGTAGIPVGAMPQETNADGEFQVSVLTSATDRGTFTLTATYLKAGAATTVANMLTVVQPITVGAAAAAPASDQKLTVGSFKGFVAIYALNYTGQKLSAKVAGKWLVVNELSKFQRVVRNTGAGFTIKVDLYIDGAFVRSETVVTK